MKHIIFILFPILLFCVTGCTENIDIEIPENMDVAEITGITVYNEELTAVAAKVTINSETASVSVLLENTEDITRLKVTLTISSGATVIKPLGTQLQDFSLPKTVTIKSPGGKVEKDWIIEITNP